MLFRFYENRLRDHGVATLVAENSEFEAHLGTVTVVRKNGTWEEWRKGRTGFVSDSQVPYLLQFLRDTYPHGFPVPNTDGDLRLETFDASHWIAWFHSIQDSENNSFRSCHFDKRKGCWLLTDAWADLTRRNDEHPEEPTLALRALTWLNQHYPGGPPKEA